MSEAVISSPELDYSQLVSSHGSYKISKCRPVDSDSQTLLENSVVFSDIELPTASKVVNFAKSFLTFKLQKTAEASDTVLHVDTLPIDRITLYDKGGAYIADITGFDDYYKGVSPYLTKNTELIRNPTGRGSNLGTKNEKGFGCFASQADRSAVVATAYGRSGARLAHAKNAPTVLVSESADVPWVGRQHVTSPVAAQEMFIEYSVPLKQFYHTILSTNRDMFFGSNLMLKIEWAPWARLGFRCTAAETSLVTGAAALAQNAAISDISLKLAVEVNPEVVGFLVNQVRSSGVTTKIPYVARAQYVNNSGTLVNNQLRLNRRNGMRLLNIYSMLFNSATTGIFAHDLCNVQDAGLSADERQIKEVSFQSSINNNQLQEYRVDANGDDFEILNAKGLLDGCTIASQNEYQHNRIHVDSWRSGAMCTWLDRDSDVDGYSLDEECVWNIDKTVVSGTYRHVVYYVCLRELNIASNGLISIN